ncbi:kinase-like protein [Obba rivulosa]|uniref:Kinase-like protein n=1 Tax=Obba rivulosa TaxID=1052685 RepID=A0A8E2J6Z3_9APHY|nr:kinase-like protein [Obba rivulosa]
MPTSVSFAESRSGCDELTQYSVASPPPPEPMPSSSVCAKFYTTSCVGKREALVLSIDRPLTIGRNPSCSYVLKDVVVSSLHCKLYAIRSSNGGIIVSCQDLSTNGVVLNGHKFRKTSVILMDGDILQIPSSQKFECIHMHRLPGERSNIFDPTPPVKQMLKTKRILNYVVTSHCLGSGSFATVHLAMDASAYRQVACKSIKRKSRDAIDKVMKEVNILISLDHPNINRVYAANHDSSFLHIFLELCTGGDLFSYIVGHKDSRLCEGETKYIMYQLLKGLKYLHDKLISHRDLKPENILLHSPGPYPRIQIADFGLARPKAYQETFTVCGTVSYLPPEGILALDHKHLGYVGMPADCWSAGIIMYIMLTGCHPFDYEKVPGESEWYSYRPSEDLGDMSSISQTSVRSDRMVKKRIVHGEVEFPENIWHNIPDAEDLCSQLLVYDHPKRATVHAALKSKWFNCELLELEAAYRERIVSG